MASPVEEIVLTLLLWTSLRNVGLYGIRIVLGFSAWEETHRLIASSSTTTAPAIHQRERGGVGGRGWRFAPRPSGAGVTRQPGCPGAGGWARPRGAVGRRCG